MSPGRPDLTGPDEQTDPDESDPHLSGPDLSEPAQPDSPARPRRRLRTVLAVVSALTVLAVASAVGYVLYLDHTVATNLTRDPGLLQGVSDRPTKATSGPAAHALDYLILGSAGPTSVSAASPASYRPQTIMIAHITARRDRVYVVVIPRDAAVEVPGHGRRSLDSAYRLGDTPLVVQTVEDLTDARMDHVALVSYTELLAAAAQGAAPSRPAADLPPLPESGPITVQGPNGPVTVSRAQALEYLRAHPELRDQVRRAIAAQDQARRAAQSARSQAQAKAAAQARAQAEVELVRQQQQVVRTLLTQGLHPADLARPGRPVGALRTASRQFTVDSGLDQAELRSTALSLRRIREKDIHFVPAPVSRVERAQGADLLVLDPQRMAALSTALREDDVAGYLRAHPASKR